jgi:hypothetical protein
MAPGVPDQGAHGPPVDQGLGCVAAAARAPVARAPEELGRLMRARLDEGDTPARKAWIGAIIAPLKVDPGSIRIPGRKGVLEQAVVSGGQVTPGVRTCIPKWRTGLNKSANTYVIEVMA